MFEVQASKGVHLLEKYTLEGAIIDLMVLEDCGSAGAGQGAAYLVGSGCGSAGVERLEICWYGILTSGLMRS